MLFSPETYQKIASVEMITPKIMVSKLDGNPHTTVISCYSTANVIDESEPEKFYRELESFTRQVLKHNTLIIGGDFSANLGQQDGFKFTYHQLTNRNGQMLKDYIQENNLVCLNTIFQKRSGQQRTHRAPNENKAQLYYVFINKK